MGLHPFRAHLNHSLATGPIFGVHLKSNFAKAEQLIDDSEKSWDLVVLDLMEEDARTGKLMNKGSQLAQAAKRFLEFHPDRRLAIVALSRSEEDMRAIGTFRREFERVCRSHSPGYFGTFGISYLHKDEAKREERGEELGRAILETLVDAGVLMPVLQIKTPELDLPLFDLENPRLYGYDSLAPLTQESTLLLYWNEFDAEEIARSILESGYWRIEPMVGYKNADGPPTIVEGNRRLAAIRGLLDENIRRDRLGMSELAKRTRETLFPIPAIILSDKRDIPSGYIAFKHHNAPFRWRGYSRAGHIRKLIEGDAEAGLKPISIKQAAVRCGDSEDVTAMYYRAFRILEQARTTPLKGKKGEVIYDPKWRYNYPFSLNFDSLALGLWRVGIQDYLGVLDQPKDAKVPVKREYFERLRQLLVWALGDNRSGTPPRLLEGTHDWGLLEALVYDDAAVDELDGGRALSEVAKRLNPRDDGDTSFMTPQARIHRNLVGAERQLNEVFDRVKTGSLNAVQWDMVRSIGELAKIIGEYKPTNSGKPKRTPWKTPT